MSRVRANALAGVSELQAKMASRKAEVDRLKKEEEERKQQEAKIFLTDPERYQLAGARQLIIRKSFAWDRMIGDLERFMPKNAKVLTIKVNGIARDENGVTASLELTALGKSAGELTELMSQFRDSAGLFEVGDINQGEMTDTGETPFTLEVQYHPRGGGNE